MTLKPTRADYVALLSSLGVDIPTRTKLSDAALKERLQKSLDASQQLPLVVPRGTIDPSIQPSWSRSSGSVEEAIGRVNIAEGLANMMARAQGRENADDLGTNPFSDVRQTLLALGKYWDMENRSYIMQDEEQTSAIPMRTVSVHRIEERTPALVILYQVGSRDTAHAALPWIRQQQNAGPLVSIKANLLEQKLFLALLEQNARIIPDSYTPPRTSTEQGFKCSIVLPLGGLGQEDVGKLNQSHGCEACGEDSTLSRCSSCQAVSYCSKECQRADWPQHKGTCKSLKGGTWHTITMNPQDPEIPRPEGTIGISINRLDDISRMRRVFDASESSDDTDIPNVYGKKYFLVKFQVNVLEPNNPIAMYDRQRSFQTYFVRNSNPEVFDQFRAEIAGPRGGHHGLKMYRYVKRVSPTEISVCLDKEPVVRVQW